VIGGLYASAAGMLAQIEHQDAISNNLANCDTPGYKRSCVSISSFRAELANAISSPSASYAQCVIPVASARQDSSQGLMQDTSNPTSLAIDGPGCFVVTGPNGRRLTRSGNFTMDRSGQLVTTDGDAVLGQNGPVRVSGMNWSVDPDGSVRVDGAVVDKLRLELPGGARAASGSTERGRIIQGRLENSNVNAIQEMVSMISGLRAYEANQRAIQALDQTLDKAINQMGKTG